MKRQPLGRRIWDNRAGRRGFQETHKQDGAPATTRQCHHVARRLRAKAAGDLAGLGVEGCLHPPCPPLGADIHDCIARSNHDRRKDRVASPLAGTTMTVSERRFSLSSKLTFKYQQRPLKPYVRN